MKTDISDISPDPSPDDRFKWFQTPVSKLVETIKANTEYLTKMTTAPMQYAAGVWY
jgi:hypothetical protein